MLTGYHTTLAQFTIAVTIAIDLMALVLLAIYAIDRSPDEPAAVAPA
jgi:hypothetical protein